MSNNENNLNSLREMQKKINNLERIIIIGYYNHKNAGDEQYIETFNYFFKKYFPNHFTCIFIDCDKLSSFKIMENDIIVFGGGDILNEYFLDNIIKKFNFTFPIKNMIHKPKNKIIAVSVGIPYDSIFNHSENINKLSIFDCIFTRTKYDFAFLKTKIKGDIVFYIPDLSLLLEELYYPTNHLLQNQNSPDGNKKTKHSFIPSNIFSYISKQTTTYFTLKTKLEKIIKNQGKIIGISLNRHIYHTKKEQFYSSIMNEFAKFIKYVLEKDKNIYICFVPFNTNTDVSDKTQNMENDIYIHEDLISKVSKIVSSSVSKRLFNVSFFLNTKEIFDLYDFFYLTIPMRLHATLFSIYKKIPFISINTTKKIKNLLYDYKYNEKLIVNMKIDDTGIPFMLNSDKLCRVFDELSSEKTYSNIKQNLIIQSKKMNEQIEFSLKKLQRTIQDFIFPNSEIEGKTQEKIFQIKKNTETIFGEKNLYKINDEELKKKISTFVSFNLTRDFHSKYYFGLHSKMFNKDYNYAEEWKWILNDHYQSENRPYHNPKGMFNIQYINQCDDTGVHRSGWNYVYKYMKTYQTYDSEIYLDLYVDRTFHWEKENCKMVGIIPYTKKWMGFIHHTFDTTFSSYNNNELLKNEDFISSLDNCLGLFVLSKTLKQDLEKELQKVMLNKKRFPPPVYEFAHPTIMKDVPEFDYSKFIQNANKKIISVGGWLRNIHTFYNLEPLVIYCEKSSRFFNFTKLILKNINNDNYFPLDDFEDKLKTLLTSDDKIEENKPDGAFCSSESKPTSSLKIKNNWNNHFFENVKHTLNSVETVDKLNNDEYDEILSKNIVFLHLVDASAVNTIIECIVRNTPIIVNYHSAVIELLGEDYPLYFLNGSIYEMNKQIQEMLQTPEKIHETYLYLKNMDKTRFHIDTFISSFISTVDEIHLSNYR